MRSSLPVNKQSGFTLIELVVVIVILGILAVTALPKFIDLSGDARTAATQGVAGALGSGSSINYANSLAKGQVIGKATASATGTTGTVDTMGGCTQTVAQNLLQSGVSFSNTSGTKGTYFVQGSSVSLTGDSVNCTLINGDDTAKQATFTLIGTK
jgi:MSHA pilin protein MshA